MPDDQGTAGLCVHLIPRLVVFSDSFPMQFRFQMIIFKLELSTHQCLGSISQSNYFLIDFLCWFVIYSWRDLYQPLGDVARIQRCLVFIWYELIDFRHHLSDRESAKKEHFDAILKYNLPFSRINAYGVMVIIVKVAETSSRIWTSGTRQKSGH